MSNANGLIIEALVIIRDITKRIIQAMKCNTMETDVKQLELIITSLQAFVDFEKTLKDGRD
jgi:hypothetical protein